MLAEYIMVSIIPLTKYRVTLIPRTPANTPNGMPIAAKTTASKNTECLNCLDVAPTLESRPNCLVLSLTEMEKEL